MRSMVEGYLPRHSRIERQTTEAYAIYPSTTFQVVPLPTASRQGGLRKTK